MAIGDRLARLKAAAESRGPLEPLPNDDDEFRPAPLNVILLPPVNPEILFPKTPEARAAVANENAGLDYETFLIQPGRRVPRLVVCGYQAADGRQQIVTGDPRDPTVHVRAFLAFTEVIVVNPLRQTGRALPSKTDDVIDVGDTPPAASEVIAPVGGLLVNQNIPFDFSAIAEEAQQVDVKLGLVGKLESYFEQVMQRIFELLDLGLVEDTMLRERLIDLAEGTLGKDFSSLTEQGNPRRKKYDLKTLSKNYLGVELDKFTWRTGYSRFYNKSLAEYPEGARKYLTDDVESALHVASRQQERAIANGLPPGARIPNSAEQSKAAFALQLVSAWGMRTSLQKVQQLDAEVDGHMRQMIVLLKDEGLIRSSGPDAGSRDMKRVHELVAKAYKDAGLQVPRTPSGLVSTAGSVLEDIALIKLRGSSEDVLDAEGKIDETELFKEPLYAYSQYASFQKIKTTIETVLFPGVSHPINTSFETLLETGRISSFKPNLNNMPRGGIKTLLLRLQAKVRQCFVPRPGFVFCSVDYAMVELCTLAQVLLWFFGASKMADAINAGFDLHTLFAAEQLLHIPYEEALARKKEKHIHDMRQLSKVGNFGLGGGMGAASLTEFAKDTYNVFLSIEEARALKEKWLTQWPEMRAYFRRIGAMMKGVDDKGQSIGDMEQFVSGRIRGRARYCATANGFFQGLAADGAKTALYELQKACYLLAGRLYGSRVVAFFYDEFLMEHPEKTAHERAEIQTEIAVTEMQQVVPDVRISAAPALQECWMKDADEVWNAMGTRRVPWRPGVKYQKSKDGKMCEPTFGSTTASAVAPA